MGMEEERKRRFEVVTQRKVRYYRELNTRAIKGETVLAGSSLCENFPINEMLMVRRNPKIVYNRGLSATVISEYSKFIDACILDLRPSKLFINIGSNDLQLPGDTIGNLLAGYRALLEHIMKQMPECKITVLAYYPVKKDASRVAPSEDRIARTQENVNLANQGIEKMAKDLGICFLNLNDAVCDAEGYLDPSIATDDVHFSPAGYERILDLLEPYL